MKRWISKLLAVSLVLLLLPGCSTLEALKAVTGENGSSQSSDPGPTASQSAPSSSSEKPSWDASSSGSGDPSWGIPPSGSDDSSYQEFPGDDWDWQESDDSLTQLQNEISQGGYAAGLAFIGYTAGMNDEIDLRYNMLYSDIGMEYSFIPMSGLIIYEGDELYAIVPPDENTTVTVYASYISEYGEYVDDLSMPLGEGLPGEALVVLCNFSDLYSNVLVVVSDGYRSVEFHPGLSGEDGRLAKYPGVYDFSIYEKQLDEDSLDIATELLLQTDEIQTAMQHGMSLMYTGETELINGQICLLFTIGTNTEEHYVMEGYYAVGDGIVYGFDFIYGTWYVLEVW